MIMAKDAYWFRHDSNASRDPKILEMRSIWGYEGYGIFWALIEYLREQDDYKLKVSEKYGYKPLAGVLGCDPDKLTGLIDDLVKEFELLVFEDGFLFSNSLINRMVKWETNKANGAKGGRPKKTQTKPNPKPKQNPNNNPNETKGITQTKPLREEDIREEDIREEKKEEIILPPNRFEEFWEAYDHKQKRSHAEREWVQAIKRVDPDLIIKKAKEYNRYRTEKDEIPMHPANWLIANRWHDEYQTKPKTPKRPLSSIPDYRNE
jgi:hypothetical protein